MKPLLTLCMMVKNEEHSIEKTLLSAKPFVDRWMVLDTGSTDRTVEIVKETMKGVPGKLHKSPFIDFATTRNLALRLCGTETQFLLLFDADDVLEGGEALRSFLENAPDEETFYIRMDTGIVFDSARVTRPEAGWHYEGKVHEVLCKPGCLPTTRVEGVTIVHRPTPASQEATKRRWERDVELLKGSDRSRDIFYLGLTYSWLGRWIEAFHTLQRRIDMGGWREEVFQAMMQQARAGIHLGHPWSTTLERFLKAYDYCQHRAEPLYEIASYYQKNGPPSLSYLFAHRGWQIPFPEDDKLFVDKSVYDWRLADLVASTAFWVGEFEIGHMAALQALALGPDDSRLKNNLEHYERRAKATIIVLTYNQLDCTRRCLESIEACTTIPYKLVIVDNASSDDTPAWLYWWAQGRPHVELILNKNNRGFAAGNNQALASAQTPFSVLLNNDTVVTEGWLERMLDVFERHPNTGLVGPRSNEVSGPQKAGQATYKTLTEMHAFARNWAVERADKTHLAYRIVGFCLVIKDEVLKTIGALDERFGRGNFEDDDYCLRARLAGFEVRIADDVFVHHEGSASFSKEGQASFAKLLEDNWKIFKDKWKLEDRGQLMKPEGIDPPDEALKRIPFSAEAERASSEVA